MKMHDSRLSIWNGVAACCLVGSVMLGSAPQVFAADVVAAYQKISDLEGNFTAALDNVDEFGVQIAWLGDLDGSGNDPNVVAVGARLDDDGGVDRGAVYLLSLNSDGTVRSHVKLSETSGNLGLQFDDQDHFGTGVASLGDLDADGVVDLAVGAFWDDDGGTNRGAVYILFLQPDGTVRSSQKISQLEGGFGGQLDDLDRFGSGMVSLGDLDGDGVQDLAVGARYDDDGGIDTGAVWILFLHRDGTVKAHQKISDTEGFADPDAPLEAGDFFGISVGNPGDFDGDGITDLVVGAEIADLGGKNRGAVYLLFLNTDGTVSDYRRISDVDGHFLGELDDNDHFGVSVAPTGDLDRDGVPDLIVGTSQDDDGGTNRGAFYRLSMNPDGSVMSYAKVSDRIGGFDADLDDSDRFALSTEAIGDLDGNGVPDLMAGAFWDDDGGTDRGSVYVLFLRPTTYCGRSIAQFNSFERGTAGGDVIDGTEGPDLIFGLGGADLLTGGDGRDCIDGGAGDDRIGGGRGDDWAIGEVGDDQLSGGPGTDRLSGGAGDDTLFGGDGLDALAGGPGVDQCVGEDDVQIACELR